MVAMGDLCQNLQEGVKTWVACSWHPLRMLPEHRMAEKSDVNNKPLKVCCELLGIDPCHVGQALSWKWDACWILKMIKVAVRDCYQTRFWYVFKELHTNLKWLYIYMYISIYPLRGFSSSRGSSTGMSSRSKAARNHPIHQHFFWIILYSIPSFQVWKNPLVF